MGRKLTIDPVTRLEGHGQIHVWFDADGRVEKARLQVPEFRAFEKLCEGRAVEELPTLTAKICGICPTVHHLASTKALDAVYGVVAPPAAQRLRELMLLATVVEDHLLHFVALSLADFLPETRERAATRNLFGVLQALGADLGGRVLAVRRRVRELVTRLGGSALYPVCGVPGGVTTVLGPEDSPRLAAVAAEALAFAEECLALFHHRLLAAGPYRAWLDDPALVEPSYYLGLVGADGTAQFYDGELRVVAPDGAEFARFAPAAFANHLAERVEEATYGKTLFLKQVGWQGLEHAESGVYRVGPLGRLNVASGLSTPRAQAELERYRAWFGTRFGEGPVHHTLAFHWARLIEVLHAAERLVELTADPELLDPATRVLPGPRSGHGVGACEAPRGTLFHHYRTDGAGVATAVNLVVGTQNNYAALNRSVQAAARRLLGGGAPTEAALNGVEVALRAYDPCFSCTTHALGGEPAGRFRFHRAARRTPGAEGAR